MTSGALSDIFDTLKPTSIEKKFCFKKVLQNSKCNKDNLNSNFSLSLKDNKPINNFSLCKNVTSSESSASKPPFASAKSDKDQKQCTNTALNAKNTLPKVNPNLSSILKTINSKKQDFASWQQNKKLVLSKDASCKPVNLRKPSISAPVKATNEFSITSSTKTTNNAKQTTLSSSFYTTETKKISEATKPKTEHQNRGSKQFKFKKTDINVEFNMEKLFSDSPSVSSEKNNTCTSEKLTFARSSMNSINSESRSANWMKNKFTFDTNKVSYGKPSATSIKNGEKCDSETENVKNNFMCDIEGSFFNNQSANPVGKAAEKKDSDKFGFEKVNN